jgi:heat shock protein HspQ
MSQGLLSFTSVFNDIDGDAEYALQERMSDPIAYAASADKDTMYMHQAMKQPDKKQFIQAMVDEVTAHTKNGH